LQCGIAAVNCGADAVYIGAARFGARESAGNGLEDIGALVSHAHKYWTKVYVTINTLLRDSEIPQARALITRLYDIGIDGLIIQDVGLLECDLPPIPIIASTQMHNNTPEKVAFLEKVGIKRAILARELDLAQIKAIREQTNIELEVFIHGALCVSYSGRCYLSYALGGRSGNRGQCAQPCRKSYSLLDGEGKTLIKNKHLLSLHDLNLSDHLADLIDAGVNSLKIEGRLKDKNYVANVVAYYRTKLDDILSSRDLQRSSSGRNVIDFAPDPEKTFNRGATTYFINGKSEPVARIETPKMIGEQIGKVALVTRRSIIVDSTIPMHAGDGIAFFDSKGELQGTIVNGVDGKAIIPEKFEGLERGTVIYRNRDNEFLVRLDRSKAHRQIPVTMTIKDSADGIMLTACDDEGNSADYNLVWDKTPADKPEQALESIQKQIGKTGGTDYDCTEVNVELAMISFLPISTLNIIRRGVLEELAAVRAKNRPRPEGGVIKNDVPYPETELSFEGNVLNRKAEAFYQRHGVTSIDPAAESGLDLHGKRVMTTRYCVKHQLEMCPGGGKSASDEPLILVDDEGNKLELRFDCGNCRMEVHLA
jgi:putative protease